MGVLSLIALFMPFVLAAYAGTALSKRGVRTWLCWTIGISVFLIGLAMFWPAKRLLDSVGCRGSSDYETCMDGDIDDD
jgi:hypothetical protein